MNTNKTQISAANLLDFPVLEPRPEPVDGKSLLDEMTALFGRFVVLPPHAAESLALWTLHTHAFHLRDVSAYLGLESPEKRCGKTTLLGVLSELVNRPVVAANISSPAFFRIIEEIQPTLLIDEADTLLRGNDELRGILNSGYTRKTAYVVRVINKSSSSSSSSSSSLAASKRSEDGSQIKNRKSSKIENGDSPITPPLHHPTSSLARFSCWCPKAIAAIGRLPDTLADRCILIRMQRKTANEQCQRLRRLQAADLRRQCARFVADHAAEIAAAEPALPTALHDRAADIWEPLFALADLAGGDWPERARQAAVTLTTGAQENNPIGSLLLDIFVLFTEENAKRLFSRDIVAYLNSLPGRAWRELTQGKDKDINELWLAHKLRAYDIRPKTIWIGKEAAKGYLHEDLLEISRRYVTRADLNAISTPDPDGAQSSSSSSSSSSSPAAPKSVEGGRRAIEFPSESGSPIKNQKFS